jgi:hypothetical protein
MVYFCGTKKTTFTKQFSLARQVDAASALGAGGDEDPDHLANVASGTDSVSDVFLFHDPLAAVHVALALQERLVVERWPAALLSNPLCERFPPSQAPGVLGADEISAAVAAQIAQHGEFPSRANRGGVGSTGSSGTKDVLALFSGLRVACSVAVGHVDWSPAARGELVGGAPGEVDAELADALAAAAASGDDADTQSVLQRVGKPRGGRILVARGEAVDLAFVMCGAAGPGRTLVTGEATDTVRANASALGGPTLTNHGRHILAHVGRTAGLDSSVRGRGVYYYYLLIENTWGVCFENL